jgi:hypothetical protein
MHAVNIQRLFRPSRNTASTGKNYPQHMKAPQNIEGA